MTAEGILLKNGVFTRTKFVFLICLRRFSMTAGRLISLLQNLNKLLFKISGILCGGRVHKPPSAVGKNDAEKIQHFAFGFGPL